MLLFRTVAILAATKPWKRSAWMAFCRKERGMRMEGEGEGKAHHPGEQNVIEEEVGLVHAVRRAA